MVELTGTLPQRKRDESIGRVLHEARHLIKQKGYYNTTVRELCDRCLISKTTFFNYFESKAGLVFMIADEFADELEAYVADALPLCPDPVERIRLAYCHILESLNRYNNLGGVFFQLVSETPARRDILARFAAILRPLIERAQQCGGIKRDISADAVGELLMGLHFTAFYSVDAEKRIDAFSTGFAQLMHAMQA